ncbi:MAG: putative Ig domain-containing protein [Steroidobacteraceae bacterium]|nr:putative Ig domain-containing protein [Steroidobacteraceae bacterium]
MMPRSRPGARTAAAALLLGITACGGGGGGGGGNPTPPLNILISTLNDGAIGVPYGQVMPVSGGVGQRSFSITSGALPAGLTMDATSGHITGIPTGPAGTTNLTLTVRDSGSPQQSSSRAFGIRIAEPLVSSLGSPPMATIGVPYSHAVIVSGGTQPYVYVDFGIPSGLAIGTDGVIRGTPLPNAVTSTSGITVRDSATPEQFSQTGGSLQVTLEVATSAMPDASGGIEYRELLRARGGLPPYDWRIIGGELPPGLEHRFLPGNILGVPVPSCEPTTYSFDVEVTDRDVPIQVGTRQGITLTVTKSPLTLPGGVLPVARLGVPYNAIVAATFGVDPYQYALVGGSLPSALSFDGSSGRINGTPDTAATHSFTIRVTDACGTTASNVYNLLVGSAPQGRNDSIATATAIGNGTIAASISPSGHPNTIFAPDQDYYSITTFSASTVTIDVDGHAGEIDTVIEIVDANGVRLGSCGPPAFTSECVNDDEDPGFSLDSFLQVRVPGPTTFYVRVVEWRFDGRPDLLYTITVSGIN